MLSRPPTPRRRRVTRRVRIASCELARARAWSRFYCSRPHFMGSLWSSMTLFKQIDVVLASFISL